MNCKLPLLRVKLRYLEEMNKRRNEWASRYVKELEVNSFSHQQIRHGVFSNYHVFVTPFMETVIC